MAADVRILSQLRAGSGTPEELKLLKVSGTTRASPSRKPLRAGGLARGAVRLARRLGLNGFIGEAPMTTADLRLVEPAGVRRGGRRRIAVAIN
jgi:hypothetical protein